MRVYRTFISKYTVISDNTLSVSWTSDFSLLHDFLYLVLFARIINISTKAMRSEKTLQAPGETQLD